MIKASAGLITIQKFIYLLDALHYTEFAGHLLSINATLPLKLAKSVRDKLPAFDTHEELCTKIYGGFEKGARQKFNQLAAYTFRLSDVLAQNYPDYLHHNINRIEQLVNEGRGKEANFMADILLDIAGRTEDFQCSIFVLNFLSQQAFIVKDVSTGIKLDSQLMKLLDREKTATSIQLFTRRTLSAVNKSKDELREIEKYLFGFMDDSSAVIRMLSRQAYLLTFYQFDLQAFEAPAIHDIIRQQEKDLHNHAHVVFSYLLDIRSGLFFMKLNSTLSDLNSKESERDFETLSQHYHSIHYWKSFVNMGELYLITIQCTRLLESYGIYLHRPDYAVLLPEKEAQIINDLRDKCNTFLKSKVDPIRFQYENLSYHIVRGVLLILSGGKNIMAGVNELESLLVSYRQANLNTETDSIFLCLMMAYFALGEYGKCAETHKRYIESIRGMPGFEVNDTKISAYYFLSQWIATGNKQYAVKLSDLLNSVGKGTSERTIRELMRYFNVPEMHTSPGN